MNSIGSGLKKVLGTTMIYELFWNIRDKSDSTSSFDYFLHGGISRE